jgi:hypothetical protein
MYSFAYGNAAQPAPSSGDTLVAGTGIDSLVGSSGNDLFVLKSNSTGDVIDGGAGTNLVDLSQAQGLTLQALHTAPVNVAARPLPTEDPGTGLPVKPTLIVTLDTSVPVVAGAPVTLAVTASSAISTAPQLTYTLQPVSGAQSAFPAGAGIDPVTGQIHWTPTASGTYEMQVVVTDSSGTQSVQIIQVTVPAATPKLSVDISGGAYTGTPAIVTATVQGSVGPTAPSLENATPTLTYYPGTNTTGMPLSAPLTTAGTYTVVASFPATTDYPASSTQTTLTIARATPTVRVAATGGFYNGSAFAATATVAGVVKGVDDALAGTL